MPGRDEVQSVLPHGAAAERARPALLRALADAVAVAEHVQRLRVVGHEHHQQRDGTGPGFACQHPPRPRGVEQGAAEGGEGVQRAPSGARRRLPRARPRRRSTTAGSRSGRPAARERWPTSATRRASCAAGRTWCTRTGSARPRSAGRRRPRSRHRRARARRAPRPAARAGRTRATGRAAPSRLCDQPSTMCSSQKCSGPAAALRRDDVEDPAEGVMRDEERQLLVDVQRRPPDRAPGEQDGDRHGGGRRRDQDDAAGALA